MPKTRDAFALRDFDPERIWKRKFLTPYFWRLPTYYFWDDDFFTDRSLINDKFKEAYYEIAGTEEFQDLEELVRQLNRDKRITNEELEKLKIYLFRNCTNVQNATITDKEILDTYCRHAVIQAENEHYPRVDGILHSLNVIRDKIGKYIKKIKRHEERLKKYFDKWNQTICEDESLSAEEIRIKSRRIRKLLKFYDDLFFNISTFDVMNTIMSVEGIYNRIAQKAFANRLRQAREKAGLTQTELAKKIGMTQGGYTNYEIANREPSFATLKKLAQTLCVSTDWLLGLTD